MRVVVVGGGIVGLSTAWACVRAGHSVTLLEQGPLPNPHASSYGAHRLIREPYGAMDGYARLIPEAYNAWDALWADLGTCFYRETGTLALGRAEAPAWTTDSAAQMDRLGTVYQRLTRAQIDETYPWIATSPGDWGFHLRTGGLLFASRILDTLAGWLRTRATVRDGVTATAVDFDAAQVETSEGPLRADAVVVAAGPWVSSLLPDLAPRVTASRQVVTYLRPPPKLAKAWADAPMLLDVGAAGFYAVPPRDGTPLKVGDHRFSSSGNPDLEREPSAQELQGVADLAAERLRGFSDYTVVGGRTCFYTVEADERFIVERRGRGVVATGFSGHGFKFGAAIGRRIASALEDRGHDLSGWAAGTTP